MQTYKWLNKAKERFYNICIKDNGNQGCILDYHWGSCITNRRATKNIYVASYEDAQKTIHQLMKRRKTRGYELVHPIIN